MLKITKIELELLTDIEIYLFVESGIRGGISQISRRYVESNNEYSKNYDQSEETTCIIYLDANNLYGASMCKYLPRKKFKWNYDEWTKEKTLSISDTEKLVIYFQLIYH